MLGFTNLEKIVREGRADEADVAKCSDYDVGYADNHETEAQVSRIVLGLLCVAKNRHSKRVQVESMRKDARKRCKIVREEYDGAHSADILPLSGLVLRCCANLIVSVDPRVGGDTTIAMTKIVTKMAPRLPSLTKHPRLRFEETLTRMK